MALELDSSSFGSFNIPSLTDSEYRGPSNGPSRRASRRGSSPLSSSPAPQRTEDEDEQIGPLDPRRFTPTLHANLVSEILSLRREVEAKNGMVLGLEESLSSARDENSLLTNAMAEQEKGGKSLKRQMQALEGGTLSAIEDVSKERDLVAETLAETRARLEASQKKVRSQQEDSERSHHLWERDQEKWEQERRNLERKVHVTEGRLRTVLTEIEASQEQQQNVDTSAIETTPVRSSSRASGRRSSASRHRDSTNTMDGSDAARAFRLSNIYETDTVEGTTLADELNFSEDDGEAQDSFDLEAEDSESGYASPEALPEETARSYPARPYSALSQRASVKARKVLGLAVEEEEDEQDAREMAQSRLEMRSESRAKTHPEPRPLASHTFKDYKDMATQFSPPPSPVLEPQEREKTLEPERAPPAIPVPKVNESSGECEGATEDTPPPAPPRPRSTQMVSSACQTIEQPLSPPDTPVDGENPPFPSFSKTIEMASASTQTQNEEVVPLQQVAATRSKFLNVGAIPTIAIRPPSSGSIRTSVVLPPQTKNASCQALVSPAVRSMAVQTEEIRIDQRPVKLPSHLLPSAISSNPPSPVVKAQKAVAKSLRRESAKRLDVPPPPLKSQRRKLAANKETDAPARGAEVMAAAKPREEAGNLSDDSFTFKEPLRKTLSKVQNSWRLVGGDGEPVEKTNDKRKSVLAELAALEQGRNAAHAQLTRHLPQSVVKEGKRAMPASTTAYSDKRSESRQSDFSSTVSSAVLGGRRSRSPSEPSLPTGSGSLVGAQYVPRFPVPERFSSRNMVPGGSLDGDGERGSPTPGTFHGRSSQRPPSKKPLRKIRSQPTRARSRSPPPPSAISSVPESSRPDLPPLPDDEIRSPYDSSFRDKHSLPSRSQPTASTATEGSRAAGGGPRPRAAHHTKAPPSSGAASNASSEQTTVVDAIAQTMIGEWMWKYVRRRKSFGLPESTAAIAAAEQAEVGTGGVRHQRWVWVAPYERAVMWSSKQPVSGSALMGKSGRKRESILSLC